MGTIPRSPFVMALFAALVSMPPRVEAALFGDADRSGVFDQWDAEQALRGALGGTYDLQADAAPVSAGAPCLDGILTAGDAVVLLSSRAGALVLPESVDGDEDGAAAPQYCGEDCNDADPHVLPAAPERCNAVSDDCDGEIDEGFPTPCPPCGTGCSSPEVAFLDYDVAYAGATVEIAGVGFGAPTAESRVICGEAELAVESWSDERIVVRVGASAPLGECELRVRTGAYASNPAALRVIRRLSGVNFGAYLHGRRPPQQISEADWRPLLEQIARYAEGVRIYTVSAGHAAIPPAAKALGLKVAVTAWQSGNEAADAEEIDGLIALGLAGAVDLAIVGNEALLFDRVAPATLSDRMRAVKAALPGVPVTTADVYSELLHPDNAEALAESDVVFAHFFPYWEGVGSEHGAAHLHQRYAELVAKAGGRPVIVGEAGWPSAEGGLQTSRASETKAASYLLNFVAWAKASRAPFFYFEAFDERWKAAEEGGPGPHWGIFTEDRVLKPGMAAAFYDPEFQDNWTGGELVGGPGVPELEATRVPVYGSVEDSGILEGRVKHVVPNQAAVTAYVYVEGKWWGPKPTFAEPTASIWPDGAFDIDVHTGGMDYTATCIALLLLPSDFEPQSSFGPGVIPTETVTAALARLNVARGAQCPD